MCPPGWSWAVELCLHFINQWQSLIEPFYFPHVPSLCWRSSLTFGEICLFAVSLRVKWDLWNSARVLKDASPSSQEPASRGSSSLGSSSKFNTRLICTSEAQKLARCISFGCRESSFLHFVCMWMEYIWSNFYILPQFWGQGDFSQTRWGSSRESKLSTLWVISFLMLLPRRSYSMRFISIPIHNNREGSLPTGYRIRKGADQNCHLSLNHSRFIYSNFKLWSFWFHFCQSPHPSIHTLKSWHCMQHTLLLQVIASHLHLTNSWQRYLKALSLGFVKYTTLILSYISFLISVISS